MALERPAIKVVTLGCAGEALTAVTCVEEVHSQDAWPCNCTPESSARGFLSALQAHLSSPGVTGGPV